MKPIMACPDTNWTDAASRWTSWTITQFHHLLCHPLTEIALHAIPHPELHLGCWVAALGCRLVHRLLGHKPSWLKHVEHLARVLGGDET